MILYKQIRKGSEKEMKQKEMKQLKQNNQKVEKPLFPRRNRNISALRQISEILKQESHNHKN